MTNEAKTSLYTRIAEAIEAARHQGGTDSQSCDGELLLPDWPHDCGGGTEGQTSPEYGEKTHQALSSRLTEHFGKGFSYRNLRLFRQFYQTYSPSIENCRKSVAKLPIGGDRQIWQSAIAKSQTAKTDLGNEPARLPSFGLSWSHYLQLLRVEDPLARRFYEFEVAKENWSVRWLNRQICSSLYERVALSKDKDKVRELSRKGNVITKPQDVLKEPYVLEFLGMKTDCGYTETELEGRLISHLQEFLLELGNGFAFMGRQVRFSFDEQHFYVDLVFYNRLLRCFVLFDLKTGTLTHQDIGQMQMYVHHYDRCVKQEYENPTIGILLCKEKSEAVVKMTLPENENIYAAEYKLYLPDANLLQQKLREWIAEEEEQEMTEKPR